MNVSTIEKMAGTLREDVVRMLLAAKSGHSAGSLDMAEVLAALYFRILRHKPSDPDWEDRDRLVLSNGHICPVLYAAMARAGYFPVEELITLSKFGSRLQGEPHRLALPGLETTSGPLGSGLSQAAGIAQAFRMDGHRSRRVFTLLSDGEHDSGNTWEAAMFIGKNHLSGLTAIIDRNGIQIDGSTEAVMPLEPLREKYISFGWHVLEVDGHNVQAIIDASEEAKAITEKPTLIIAHTIPGKGVDFMEYDYTWHGKVPGAEEAAQALRELRSLGGRINGEHD